MQIVEKSIMTKLAGKAVHSLIFQLPLQRKFEAFKLLTALSAIICAIFKLYSYFQRLNAPRSEHHVSRHKRSQAVIRGDSRR